MCVWVWWGCRWCVCVCVYWIAPCNEGTTLWEQLVSGVSEQYQGVLIWTLSWCPTVVLLSVQTSRTDLMHRKTPCYAQYEPLSSTLRMSGHIYSSVCTDNYVHSMTNVFGWTSHPSSLLERHPVQNKMARRWLCAIFFFFWKSSGLFE